MPNPWLLLLIAGLLEVGWAIGLKYTQGFTKPLPSVLTIITMIASFYFLAQALKTIPVGTGYAVWTGIGAVGTAILGIVLFAESSALPRLACIGLIVAGIIGLKLTSPT
ncbi:quaternary ammonium compound efflux SMR transporter SugE [Microbulbifer hydrolyticus]|uniref:Guanidinium exporter n=1 Tax=Microbulbifer hydrolyticus TaxID=48074 RepID=A0A6P1T4E4_9GAMM|nr:quaternary ammonium compound efflux SMR transporter SugE [Microbulbifer hydrolyticus]MBB5211649.1 quaternary ammonium compound-resistance protein SugE [Microbulbifer hydrolyticus]QHQ37618.1 quaternary ammonium compound efflux SMR transporter SugE [Microbulbifer hydrolyticus]